MMGFYHFNISDSIQTNNIPNVCDYITVAPEINLILSTDISGSDTFSILSIYNRIYSSKEVRNSIYDKWREDKILFERNKYIAEMYQVFGKF